jgi:hypothetical protein
MREARAMGIWLGSSMIFWSGPPRKGGGREGGREEGREGGRATSFSQIAA